MRVLVPHVGGRDPRVEEALWLADADAGFETVIEWVDVSRSSTAYAELVAEAWSAGDTFAIVEHDIAVHPGVLAGFQTCPQPYCCYPYQLGGELRPALGCTRFHAQLLADYPDAMRRVLRVPTSWGDPGHWRQLDVILQRTILLNRFGLHPHVHTPPVAHLSVAPDPAARLVPLIPASPALVEP